MDDLLRQIETYPPTMRLDTAPGERVIFTDTNGLEGDRRFASGYLKAGESYEVESVAVGGWSSTVKLKDIAAEFNTVMFENAGAPDEQ